MNCRYFLCKSDGTYIDAGYRWAYWLIEDTGVVKQGEPVDIDLLFNTSDYWNPPAEERSDWLYKEILPAVKKYLEERKGKEVLYVESEYIWELEEDGFVLQEIKTSK